MLQELKVILDYWNNNTSDKKHGGFYGAVNTDNFPDTGAPKGIVLLI
jgi:hypothetical protein